MHFSFLEGEGWLLIRGWALTNFSYLQGGRLFEVGRLSNKYGKSNRNQNLRKCRCDLRAITTHLVFQRGRQPLVRPLWRVSTYFWNIYKQTVLIWFLFWYLKQIVIWCGVISPPKFLVWFATLMLWIYARFTIQYPTSVIQHLLGG